MYLLDLSILVIVVLAHLNLDRLENFDRLGHFCTCFDLIFFVESCFAFSSTASTLPHLNLI